MRAKGKKPSIWCYSVSGKNSLQCMVMSCQTMKVTWDALSQCFEQKTVSNKVYTLMQLYGLCKERGTRIQVHLHQLKHLSNYLASIGEAVSEMHMVITMHCARWLLNFID